MKKKLFMLVAVCVVVVISAVALVACNNYKWTAVSGGDASAAVTSNGGYVVEQGGYVYFINGYVGADADNTWGTPYKQSIMRCKVNEDGTFDNSTATVIVPKSIYQNNVKSGFAIFGNWIYYCTPNNEKDSSGTASTTHTDVMRTSLDGSITQLIATLNSRSYDMLFTPTRVLYYNTNVIYYIDFSGMKTNKSISDGKGATSGTLVERVATYSWNYDANYQPGQGVSASDYVFYTQTNVNSSYEYYNTLNCIRYDGTDQRTLATYSTYLTAAEAEHYADYYADKVFQFSLINTLVEDDATVTLYYTKTNYPNNTAKNAATYQNKFTLADGMKVADERKIASSALTSITPISYSEGCVVLNSVDSFYYLVNTYIDGTSTKKLSDNTVASADSTETIVASNLVIGEANTIQCVKNVNGNYYAVYTDSDNKAFYAINVYKGQGVCTNEAILISATPKTAVFNYDTLGNKFFFFDTADYDYVHYINLDSFDGITALTSTILGKYNAADQATYDAAQE